ncbi:30S ribosomal protein S15 [Bacillus sp. NRRL B-14911]|nr:30S ribosomal protein S15 [Bacillus sp. NRRL B-14911]
MYTESLLFYKPAFCKYHLKTIKKREKIPLSILSA